MSQIRRAALSLHGLGDADRAWMLARLPEAQREDLERLIAELDALGFPRGAAAAPAEAPAAPAPPPREPSITERLESVKPRALFLALDGASPALVSALLRQRQWRWSRGLLRRFDRRARSAIAAQVDAGVPVSPRVERELLGLLCGALGVSAPRSSAPDGGE